MSSSAAASVTDTTAWNNAERAILAQFISTQAQVQTDMSSNVSTFEAEMQTLLAAETLFSSNISSVAASVGGDAIDAAIKALQVSDSNIDYTFSQLDALIVSNNAAAAAAAAQIDAASSSIALLATAQSNIDAKISGYAAAISSFRSFMSNVAV